jgi:hypothetical protein
VRCTLRHFWDLHSTNILVLCTIGEQERQSREIFVDNISERQTGGAAHRNFFFCMILTFYADPNGTMFLKNKSLFFTPHLTGF